MRIRHLAIVALLALPAPALADAVDDGNAGLDALNSGDYARAVTLFTHALKSGELQGDDKEFAYLNRGKAYLGEGQNRLAAADLRQALKLKPDDQDAQDALQEAEAARQIDGSRGPARAAHRVMASWGMLANMAGRYYWSDREGTPGHAGATRCEWEVTQQELVCISHQKAGSDETDEYKMDTSGRTLMLAAALPTTTVYGSVVADNTQISVYFFINNAPARSTSTLQPDGSMRAVTQVYTNGAWNNAATDIMTPATEDDVEQAGFFKKPKAGDKPDD